MADEEEDDVPTTINRDDWLSPRQVADLTGLSDQTIRRMIHDGRLAARRTPGGWLRVHKRDVPKL
jgi:excisionase family DNA binding protein